MCEKRVAAVFLTAAIPPQIYCYLYHQQDGGIENKMSVDLNSD